MLSIPHEAEQRKSVKVSDQVHNSYERDAPLLLLSIHPCAPIILEIISSIFQRWRSNALTVTSTDEVD